MFETHSPIADLPKPGLFHFLPILELVSGEAVSLMVEHRRRFADAARFGPAFEARADGDMQTTGNPALWLADRLERAAASEAMAPGNLRPIYVPGPDAAFTHEDTAMACRAAIARTRFLPQEYCIEFTDTAFTNARDDIETRVRNFRRHGFRVGLDIRRSRHTALSFGLRLMLDTLRFNGEDIDSDDVAQSVEAAREAGMCVMAEKPRWRDADRLVAMGVSYALAPIADA